VVFTLPYLVAFLPAEARITSAGVLVTAVVGLNVLSGYGGQISPWTRPRSSGSAAYTAGNPDLEKWALAPPLAFVVGIAVCFSPSAGGRGVARRCVLQREPTSLSLTLAVGVIFPRIVSPLRRASPAGTPACSGLSYTPPNIPYFSGAGRADSLALLGGYGLPRACPVSWSGISCASRTGRGNRRATGQ